MKTLRPVRNQFSRTFVASLLVFFLFFIQVLQVNAEGRMERAYTLALRYEIEKGQVDSQQELLDQVFSQRAAEGNTMTFVTSLYNVYPKLRYSKYLDALVKAVSEQKLTETQYQKVASVFYEIEKQNPFEKEAEFDLQECTIMTLIWGIKARNSVSMTTKEMIDELIRRQLPTGGFSYQGNEPDVDVTAMALQALAPHQGHNESAKKCIEDALVFLENAQLAEGDFASMGKANCESTAQVLLALSCLDINPLKDSRFIKKGYTIIDGLCKYQLESGGFTHAVGGYENEMATAEAMEAISVHINHAVVESVWNSSKAKWIYTLFVIELASLATYKFRKSKKKMEACWGGAIVIIAIIWAVTFTAPSSEKEANHKNDKAKSDGIEVTLSIECVAALHETPAQNNNTDFDSILPENGLILETTSYQVEDGTTVYELLKQVCAEEDLNLDVKGNTAYGSAYVKEIHYLSEFDFGELSGWMYLVNGEFPSVGCGEYELHDQDEVRWVYSLNLGKDIEVK